MQNRQGLAKGLHLKTAPSLAQVREGVTSVREMAFSILMDVSSFEAPTAHTVYLAIRYCRSCATMASAVTMKPAPYEINRSGLEALVQKPYWACVASALVRCFS